VTQTVLERTERLEPALNAYITLTAEAALEDARRAEQEIMTGGNRGPLHGVPLAIKDNFWVKGVRCTNGSRVFADFVPDADAAAVSHLRAAGAVLLGKTNVPEMCFVTHRGHAFPIPGNPWDPGRHPGGSSSGSGIAVAAGCAYGALGSDTNGSVRFPASWCGVTGLKPTFGRISLDGAFPACRDFDHAGPLARSVLDCAHLLDALTGYDPRSAAVSWAAGLAKPNGPLRIGVPRDYFWENLQPAVRQQTEAALDVWRALGWTVQDVTLPPVAPVAEAAWFVTVVNIAAEYRTVLTVQTEQLTELFREQFQPALTASAVHYLTALRLWQDFDRALETVFGEVDALVTPTRSRTAPRQAADGTLIDPFPPEGVGFAAVFNLPGVPAISIPAGLDEQRLPIGVQIVGPRSRDDLVLATGHAFQQATDWHLQRPPLS
jgi:Asp-tRNA(Asn)/Glu-tRNA(Gln) amidotransferase A subunit family amidase